MSKAPTNVEQTQLIELQESLEALEVKLSYQEDTIESLNQTIIKQQEKITSIEFLLDKLVDKVKSMPDGDSAINAQVELPPHY